MEPQPFNLNEPPNPADRLDQPRSVGQMISATGGMAVMGISGMAVAAGFVVATVADLFALGIVLLVIGLWGCSAGYRLYSRGQRRRRSDHR